jgi:hypothetical protein
MVRRIARPYDNAVAICPNCKTRSKFFRTTKPQIDSCGFESYSFQGIAPVDVELGKEALPALSR